MNGNADGLSRQSWNVEMQPDNTSQFVEVSKDLHLGECGAQRRPQKIIALATPTDDLKIDTRTEPFVVN